MTTSQFISFDRGWRWERHTEIRKTDNKVGKHEGCRAVESIGALFDKSCAIF
jgi:hypothetical protein